MKKYLVFIGNYYYAGGGWNDFKDHFDTYKEAIEYMTDNTDEYTQWSHIVEWQSRTIVMTAGGGSGGS